MKPLHYCPLCNADSWYAPQPPRDEWPKWQAYQCGTLTIYSENGEQIDNTFTYHAPKNDQTERYQRIREWAKELATVISRTSEREAALLRLIILAGVKNPSLRVEYLKRAAAADAIADWKLRSKA